MIPAAYAVPVDGETVTVRRDASGWLYAGAINYGAPGDPGGALAGARVRAQNTLDSPRSHPAQRRRATGMLTWLDADPATREAMAMEADRAAAARQLIVERREGELYVDGELFWSDDAGALTAGTCRSIAGARTTHDPGPWHAVADFIDSADQRAAHAQRVGAPVTGPVPAPPQRPAIRLRSEVEVDGLPSVDLAVYVHPSAVDTAHAVTTAARALHDAALAALHVLVVEPADPAGGAS